MLPTPAPPPIAPPLPPTATTSCWAPLRVAGRVGREQFSSNLNPSAFPTHAHICPPSQKVNVLSHIAPAGASYLLPWETLFSGLPDLGPHLLLLCSTLYSQSSLGVHPCP